MRPLRIAHFYRDYLLPGGLPRETELLARAMAREGHRAFVYCYTADPDQEGAYQEAGVLIRKIYLPRWAWERNCLYAPRALRKILYANQDQLDGVILVGGFIPENHPVAKILTAAGIPYVLSPNAAFNPLSFRGVRRITKHLYERCFERYVVDHALAVRLLSSVQEQHFAMRGYDLSKGRCFVAKEGVDWEKIHAENVDTGTAPPAPASGSGCSFGYLGRLSIYTKGLDLLLDAWAAYRARGGAGTLKIVGPDESGSAERLKRRCRELNLDQVEILPPKYGPDKYVFLKEISVFVHPSRFDGIPRVIREALAVGCPLIITEHTNLHDLVAEYGAGLITRLDAADLAAQILTFSRAHATGAGDYRAGALQAAAQLDWDVIARGYVQELALRLGKGYAGGEVPTHPRIKKPDVMSRAGCVG